MEGPLQNKSLAAEIRQYLMKGGTIVPISHNIMWKILCPCIIAGPISLSMWQNCLDLQSIGSCLFCCAISTTAKTQLT